MKKTDIISHRLFNQQITQAKFTKPEELVHWMVAMQAQEFNMVKWALGLRLPGIKESTVEDAFNKGSILRTHLLRPTWHFVSPEDIRWLLELTGPRINAVSAHMNKKLELDSKILKRTNDIIAKALEGKFLTRTVIQTELKKKKIIAEGLRLMYVLFSAELNGIICSGPRQGKQFTYALLEERVKPFKKISREEAVNSLVKRYFITRGPATIKDFVSWSGLTMKDARAGVAALPKEFITKDEYILNAGQSLAKKNTDATFMMPDYDEYAMSYKDRSALFDAKEVKLAKRDGNPIWNHVFVVDGVIKGTWDRSIVKKELRVQTSFYEKLNKTQQQKADKAIKKYIAFFDLAP